MKRRILSVVLIAAVLLSFGGVCIACAEEDIEISFMTIWAPNDDTQPNRARNELIKEFEAKYDNVKVVNNSIPQDEFLTKIVQMSISDTLPDLFMCLNNHLVTMIDNDRILPVSEYLSKIDGWEEQFIPATFNDLKVDGVAYGIPYQWQGNAFLWSNKSIFDEIGEEIPQTLEELLAVTPKLRAAGYTPVALGNSNVEGFGVIVLNAIIEGWVDGEWLADMLQNREPGKLWSGNEGWYKAMKWLEDAGKAGVFNADCNALAENDAYLLYANKEAAMNIIGGWFGEWLELNATDEVRNATVCSYVPLTENSRIPANAVCAVSTWGWQINKKLTGEKLDRVLELLYMFTAEPYTRAALKEGFIRVPCFYPEDADFSNVGSLTAAYAELTDSAYPTPDYFNAMMDSDLRYSFGEIFQSLIIGEMTAEEAIKAQQEVYDLML